MKYSYKEGFTSPHKTKDLSGASDRSFALWGTRGCEDVAQKVELECLKKW